MKRLLLFFVGVFLMPSCISEDRSSCPSSEGGPITIGFTFPTISQDGRTGIDPATVKDISLFVFDKEGNYLKSFTDENITFSKDYTYEITSLAPGSYRFVAWGNAISGDYKYNFTTKAANTIGGMVCGLDIATDGIVDQQITQLYYGQSAVTEITGKGSQVIPVSLIENTNLINITVEGIGELDNPAGNYNFAIADDNGLYSFENSFIASRKFDYTTTLDSDGVADMNVSLRILRISDSRSPMLKITNITTSKTVFGPTNLMELIKMAQEQGAEIDYDLTSKYDIIIDFKSPLNLVITINGWSFSYEQQDI